LFSRLETVTHSQGYKWLQFDILQPLKKCPQCGDAVDDTKPACGQCGCTSYANC
jgi:hypothetical protein